MTTGHLELILGPMFAGKTTELIKCINRYKHITNKYFLVNHIHDTRYENDSIVEHNEISKFKTTHTTDKLMSLLVDDDFNNIEFIFIDEGQFFSDIIEFVKKAVDIHNKKVIISGLIGDYKREPFGDILKLIPLAENVTILKALCKKCSDGTFAHFTKRTNVNNNKQILVGNDNIYEAVCRYHYLE
jgi:thymidine kinase